MTVGDLIDKAKEDTLVQLKTEKWYMDNPLSVGVIRELMYEKIADMQVGEIHVKDWSMHIWAKDA